MLFVRASKMDIFYGFYLIKENSSQATENHNSVNGPNTVTANLASIPFKLF
uniref:Uncharacterized protein n=1 Tax=Lepeophtheirus salmonis TaxID=72036 RepID=A0A0K2TK39_LEPSM